ncbi:MAG: DUF4198 domain-containing protein [Candidatus Kryptoniota bacterium]
MKKSVLMIALMIFITGIVSTAQGHMLWLNASDYSPKIGEKVTIEIGFGHKYPNIETVKEENIERIFIRDPEGQEFPIEKVAPAKYTFSPKAEGQYEVIVKLKQGFVSNTPDGRKLGNKKTLKDVASCLQFNMNAKALINAGSKGKGSNQQSDLPLEIIPTGNINKLKIGDQLLLKVMYQGKPLKGAKISATDEKSALQQEGKWVQESESDAEGMVRVKLISKGPWLFTAAHEIPYADSSECDKSLYRTTLTIRLK